MTKIEKIEYDLSLIKPPWASRPMVADNGELLEAIISKSNGNLTVASEVEEDDATFIANSPINIVWLLEELKRKNETIKNLRQLVIDAYYEGVNDMSRQVNLLTSKKITGCKTPISLWNDSDSCERLIKEK